VALEAPSLFLLKKDDLLSYGRSRWWRPLAVGKVGTKNKKNQRQKTIASLGLVILLRVNIVISSSHIPLQGRMTIGRAE